MAGMTDFRLTPDDARGYKVELDGHDVTTLVSGVELGVYAGHDAADGGVTLLLRRVGTQVHLPDADVRIDVDSAGLLERLGWTPPKGRDGS
jgi:hypothetical protein